MRTFNYMTFKESVNFAKTPNIKKPFKGSLEIEEVIFGSDDSDNKQKFLNSWVHEKFSETQKSFIKKTVENNI